MARHGSFLSPSPKAKAAASTRRSPGQIEALIIDLLVRSNRPVSAYDLASRSIAAGHPLVPNQVYRSLSRLIEQGRVHKIESLSAYVAKREPFDACLICDTCHAVVLVASPDPLARLLARADRLGFTAVRPVLEAHGHCPDCVANARSIITDPAEEAPSPFPGSNQFGV